MTEENVEIVRRAYEAFNRGGVERILEFLDPEIEWRAWEEIARAPRVYHGHDGVREVLGVYEENFDEIRAEPHEFIDAGEQTVVPFRLTGKAKGSGEEASFELVHVWTGFGVAKRLDVYSSKAEALEAVGIGSAE